MSDVKKTISIIYNANTKALETALKRIPKETDKQFKKLPLSLNKNLKRAEKDASTASKKIGESFKSMQAPIAAASVAILGLGAAALKAGQMFFDMNRKIADSVNQLVDAQSKTGVHVDTLKALRLSAEGAGRSFDSIENGLIRFQSSISMASEGSKKQADAFARLGVKTQTANGELRDSDQVFNEVIESLAKMESGTQKNVIAIDLFGRSAGSALLQSGAIQNMREFRNLTQEFGIDTGPEAIETAARFQREFATFGRVAMAQMDAVIRAFGGQDGLNSMIRQGAGLVIFYGEKASQSLGGAAKVAKALAAQIISGNLAMSGQISNAVKMFKHSMSELGDGVTQIAVADAVAAKKVQRFNQLMDATLASSARAQNTQANAIRGRQKASTDAASKANDEAQKQAAAIAELEKIQEAAHKSQLSNVEKILFDYEKQKEKIIELGEIAQDKTMTEITLASVKLEKDKAVEMELDKMREKMAKKEEERIKRLQSQRMQLGRLTIDSVASSISTLDSMQTAGFQRQQEQIETEISELESQMSDKSFEEMSKKEQIMFQGQQKRLQMLKSEAATQEEAANKSMAKFHRMNQLASLAQIGMSLAEGIMRATATYIGNPIALGIAQSVLFAASGVQAAAVLAQPPPTMHTGGIVGNNDPLAPDEQMIRAKKGEMILNTTDTRRQQNQDPAVIVISPFRHIDRYNKSALRYNSSLRSINRRSGRRR